MTNRTIYSYFVSAAEGTLSSEDAGKLTSWMEKHLGRKIKCCKVSELFHEDRCCWSMSAIAVNQFLR